MKKAWMGFVVVAALALSVVLAQGPGMPMGHGPQAQMGLGMGMMSQVSSELDFLRHMIVHHQEAIKSATQLLALTEREELQELLESIIEVQSHEIMQMEGWLEQWYPDEAREVDYQPMMRDLSGLSPKAAEQAFLEDMVMHHMMAVHDSRQLLMQGLTEREEVAALAQDIIAGQMREMMLMQSWLRDWYGTSAMGMMGQGQMEQRQRQGMMQGQGMMQRRGMGAGMMRQGSTPSQAEHYGRQTVEALARAFLAGYQPDAEIIGIESPTNVYTITFRSGSTTGTLLVNAGTGEVRLESLEE